MSKNPAAKKIHRDSGEISIIKVIKNYFIRIIFILLSKIITIRFNHVNFKLIIQENPSKENTKGRQNEFVNADINNLTISQFYSKNEKFIFNIKICVICCQFFKNATLFEKNANLMASEIGIDFGYFPDFRMSISLYLLFIYC